MKIKDTFDKWVDVTRGNYEEFLGETTVNLGEGVGVVKTDDPDAAERLKTAVTGTDGTFNYYYYYMNLGKNKNGTAYIINGYAYTILMKGETPIEIDDNMAEGLPVFKIAYLENQDSEEGFEGSSRQEHDYNLLAYEYFGAYSFVKYNEEIYYFHPEKYRWQLLKEYPDYNILISLKNKNYVQRDKRQIMDSMQIYLHQLEPVSLNKNLLLFKNNKVLNIITQEVTEFDGTQFILNTLNANWYELESEIPAYDYYLDKLLRDLAGWNIYRTPVEEKRYHDLLRYLGYIFTDMQKQNGLMLYGKSQNGKSTLAALAVHIKNSGFKPAIQPLLNDVHYISGFYNDRILFFDELKKDHVTDKFVSVFNQLLGDDRQSIRPLNHAPITVDTNFTAMITVNEISDEWVTYRALLRRIKIMKSTFQVVTNLPPNVNLNDELRKQNNVDWLANTAIRSFIANNYRIDNLFVDDMSELIYKQNLTARKYLDILKELKYIDDGLNLIVDTETFKSEQSQINHLNKDLKYVGDLTTFDEQINIVFQFVLGINDMSCVNGGITWR